MKDKLFIISNESIYIDKNNRFFCDNLDLKSIPEGLSKYFEVNIIGRYSNKKRTKKIELKKINVYKNIFAYLYCIFKKFNKQKSKYLIISLSPYTFLASILLKLFLKRHFIYLRSDGYEEYKSILGNLGKLIYHLMFSISVFRANLIACREHLLRKNKGNIVNPSQLNDNWFKDQKEINQQTIKLLYVGRIRVEKGIFSLAEILKDKDYNLTIVTPELDIGLKEKNKNINIISFENYNDSIIKFYDEHSIFILPSYTEAHPQVLDESLARLRPVIVFNEIKHVKRDREGVFVCERNFQSLKKTINYITNNYQKIVDKIKGNKLPTKKNFIDELKNILTN